VAVWSIIRRVVDVTDDRVTTHNRQVDVWVAESVIVDVDPTSGRAIPSTNATDISKNDLTNAIHIVGTVTGPQGAVAVVAGVARLGFQNRVTATQVASVIGSAD